MSGSGYRLRESRNAGPIHIFRVPHFGARVVWDRVCDSACRLGVSFHASRLGNHDRCVERLGVPGRKVSA